MPRRLGVKLLGGGRFLLVADDGGRGEYTTDDDGAAPAAEAATPATPPPPRPPPRPSTPPRPPWPRPPRPPPPPPRLTGVAASPPRKKEDGTPFTRLGCGEAAGVTAALGAAAGVGFARGAPVPLLSGGSHLRGAQAFLFGVGCRSMSSPNPCGPPWRSRKMHPGKEHCPSPAPLTEVPSSAPDPLAAASLACSGLHQ